MLFPGCVSECGWLALGGRIVVVVPALLCEAGLPTEPDPARIRTFSIQ